MKKKIFILILLISLFFPIATGAANYNLNNIITDNELTDNHAMSLTRIKDFLKKKGGAIANYVTRGINGALKSASEVIYDASQYYKLSPKYFLVRIQVEQALVTDPTPSSEQYNEAAGYGCPDGSVCDPAYSGFFNQINQSAKSLRGEKYLSGIETRGMTISGWGPGITKTTLDGIKITPANAATAVLYTYTPWVGKYGGGDQRYGGTSLFSKIWREWFSRLYPDGTLLQEQGTSGVYLIQNSKIRAFRNETALLANYDPGKIILVSGNEINAYENGPAIRFPDNVLIQSPKGTVYLVTNGEKRGIASQKVLQKLGFNPDEIITVSWGDIQSLPEGKPVTKTAVYPTGILLQSRQTGGISYIENGIRHSIWSKEILNSRYKNRTITIVDQSEIDHYSKGDPIKFKDGELVTAQGSNAIYVISKGVKRPFKSADVFNSLGYSWKNIIYTTPQALAIHPTGEIINLK